MHVFPVLFITTADYCARTNLESMSEQTHMELFVSELFDANKFKDDCGGFQDISQWIGVKLSSDNDKVCQIDWGREPEWMRTEADDLISLQPGGSIDFKFAPPGLTHLFLPEHELTGTAETNDLPRSLEEFNVHFNRFEGKFDVENLPKDLRLLAISRNKFSGSFAIAMAPRALVAVDASSNNFTGSIDLTSLWQLESLQRLALEKNSFCGAVTVSRFPELLAVLYLEGNNFQEEPLVLGDIPYGCAIRISGNSFHPIRSAGDTSITVRGKDDFLEIRRKL